MAPSATKACQPGDLEQTDRIAWVESGEHARVLDDLSKAQEAQGCEPDQHHRAEELADAGGAAALDQEEGEQHEGGDRYHVGVEGWGCGLQTLDRREDRDRGRDQAVAVEEGKAGDRQRVDETAECRGVWQGARGEGAERQHPTLAAIVGAQDEDDVLERDDEDQRPEDEREDAQHGGLAQVQATGMAEGLAHRVERAGADVAVDHPDRSERERAHAAPCVTRLVWAPD